MQIYIPEPLLNNPENLERIYDILDKVPDTDFKCLDYREEGELTLDDAIQAIRELGEDKIADFIMV